MKIALINPPIFDPAHKQGCDLTPLGLLKIAPWLKLQGHQVALFQFDPFYNEYLWQELPSDEVSWHVADVNIPFDDGIRTYPIYYRGTRPKIILERLTQFNPDEVWITSGLTYHFQGIHLIVSLVKRYMPKVVIRIGGILASLAPEKIQFLNVNEIYEGQLQGIDAYQIDYSYLERYPGITNLKLHRGCVVPSPCTWCAVKALEPNMQLSDIDQIKKWIINRARKGDKIFRVWSSNLFVNKSYRKKLLAALQAIYLDYGCEFEAAEGVEPWLFDEETAIQMFNAGFRKVSLPLESHIDNLRNEWGKPGSVHQCLAGIKAGIEAGLHMRTFCMIGVAGQTIDDVHGVIEFSSDVGASPRLNAYTPIPKTKLWTTSNKKWDDKHLLLTNGYLWPEVDNISEAMKFDELIERNMNVNYTPFRGGPNEERNPPEEDIFFQDLFWPN